MSSPGQLEMVRPHLDGLPHLTPRPGCTLRGYLTGDEEHWARIMNECIGEGWTAETCRAELMDRPIFRPDRCFFAVVEGIPQGTATAWERDTLPPGTGYMHMVGVSPLYRGRGLGELVSLATLHWFREHGFERALLHTDDWRIPAIGTYLKLGFEPVIFDEEHARRWREVRETLRSARVGRSVDALSGPQV